MHVLIVREKILKSVSKNNLKFILRRKTHLSSNKITRAILTLSFNHSASNLFQTIATFVLSDAAVRGKLCYNGEKMAKWNLEWKLCVRHETMSSSKQLDSRRHSNSLSHHPPLYLSPRFLGLRVSM